MAGFHSPSAGGRSISLKTMSTMPSRRSSLLATWLYSDIASTPTCSPSLRMLIEAMPSLSASSTAARTRRSRTSGREYATPVVAAPTDGGFVIALPYGPNTDWLKNVLARGSASILFDGQTYDVAEPAVIAIDDANSAFHEREQRRHRQFNVRQ